jgi:integrase
VKPFDFHAIRHLVATKMYHEGKELSYIQYFLRHLSPNTTVNYLRSLGLDGLIKAGIDDVLKRPAEVIEFPKKNDRQGII